MFQEYYQNERRIDLIRFLKRLCVQWRAIVAVGLIVGLAVMSGKYMIDSQTYQKSLTLSNERELSSVEIEEGMTDLEKSNVYLAVNAQKQIEATESYLHDSLYMNLDPESYKTVSVYYMIETDEDIDAYDVGYLYYVYLTSDETITSLKSMLGFDVDNASIREIYNVYRPHSDSVKRNRDYMVLYLYLPEDYNVDDAYVALESIMENCTTEKEMLSSKISLVDCTERRQASQVDKKALMDAQLTARNTLVSLNNSQKDRLNNFSASQEKLYSMLLSNSLSDDYDDEIDLQVDGSTAAVAPKYDGKFFALGFLFGVSIYVIVFWLNIVLNPYVVEWSVYENTKTQCLGFLKIQTNKKKSWYDYLLHDDLVHRLLYKKQESVLTNPSLIISKMQASSSPNDGQMYQILQIGFDKSDDAIIKDLLECGKKQNQSISITSLDLNHIDEVFLKVSSAPAVVAICEKGTLKQDIRVINEILRSRQVQVLGELQIGE